jgi:hypothetical protein
MVRDAVVGRICMLLCRDEGHLVHRCLVCTSTMELCVECGSVLLPMRRLLPPSSALPYSGSAQHSRNGLYATTVHLHLVLRISHSILPQSQIRIDQEQSSPACVASLSNMYVK